MYKNQPDIGSSYTNPPLPPGTTVQRIADGMLGTIERFVHQFGKPPKTYNCYYVRWDNGCLGMPSDYGFDVLDIPLITSS